MRFPDPWIGLMNLRDVMTKLVGGTRLVTVLMAVGAATVTAYPSSGSAGKPLPVWPVPGPAPLPGSILPATRIVASFGNPFSTRTPSRCSSRGS
jgi:hypothetical protein